MRPKPISERLNPWLQRSTLSLIFMTQITFPLLDQNGPAPQTTDFRAARAMLDCSLRSRGSRLVAAAFLAHSQTKSVSACSFVQDSGARSWRMESAYFVGARGGKCLRSLLPQHGGARFPDARSQGFSVPRVSGQAACRG